MELVCVLVLAFVSLVTANPYGYGVKGGGGAAAKADASAAAGTFGGIRTAPLPLSIPSGSGGYSGSFSKSSSSSFASSSASSSSSAFSFSGSHGGPGITFNGVTGNTKCTTGSCRTGGYGSTGSGINGAFSGANAAASAGAGAIVFPGSYGSHSTPCIGDDCTNKKPACDGTYCEGSSGDKKCSSNECGQASGSPMPGYGSNDIFISTASSKSTDESTTESGSGCAYGICGPTAASNTKPFSHVTSDVYPSSTASVHKPSTDLTAPKEEPCTSPNCGLPSSGSYDKDKPSSYNVPANTVYSQSKAHCTSGNCGSNQPNFQHQPLPTGPSGSPQPTSGLNVVPSTSQSDYPDFVPLQPTGNPSSPPSPSKQPSHSHSVPSNTPVNNAAAATGTNTTPGSYDATKTINAPPTQNVPYTGGFGGPTGILKPNEFSAPPKIPTTGNYKPASPTLSTPSAPNTDSFNPSTCTSGNCRAQTVQSNLPSGLQHKPAQPTGSYKPTTCVSGNCGTQPGQSGSNTSIGPSGLHNPNILIGPSGSYNLADCSSGNCGSLPTTPQQAYNKPVESAGSYNPTSSSASFNPSSPSSSYNPTSSSASYNPSSPTSSYNPSSSSTSHSPSSTSEQYNPARPSNSNKPIPHYDQSGSYKPTGPTTSHYPTGTSGSQNHLQFFFKSLAKKISCNFGNCGSQPNQPTPPYGQSDSYKPTGPSSLSESYNPTGCASGNCETKPTQTGPQHEQNNIQFSGGSYNPTFPLGSHIPTDCSSGSCGSQPGKPTPSYGQNPGESQDKPTTSAGRPVTQPLYGQNGASQPTNPAGSYNPSGSYSPTACKTGKCDNQPSTAQNGQSESYKPSGFVSTSNPSSSGLYSPTGSVESPTTPQQGPSDSFYKPTGSFSPTSCSAGNCGSQPSQTQPGSTGLYNPIGSLKPYNPSACSSGDCKPQPGQQPSQFGSSESPHKPPSPTGSYAPTSSISGQFAQSSSSIGTYKPATPVTGFGGPPGILKPNEFVAPSGQPGISSITSSGSYTPSCTTGICGPQTGYPTPQGGQNGATASHFGAGAAAIANAIAYTGGFGGPPGFLQPYDGKIPGGNGPQTGNKLSSAPGAGIHSSYGKSLYGGNVGTGAISGAAAGSYGGNSPPSGGYNHVTGGCNGGCGHDSSGLGYNGAAAKSAANAGSANIGAYSSSFASSSASAHATAGAGSKGGYGKR